jgi:hypothetical protein
MKVRKGPRNSHDAIGVRLCPQGPAAALAVLHRIPAIEGLRPVFRTQPRFKMRIADKDQQRLAFANFCGSM